MVVKQSLRLCEFLASLLVMLLCTAPALAQTPIATPIATPGLEGLWFEVTVDCPYCANFETQTLALSRDATLIRYSDRLDIQPTFQAAKLSARNQGNDVNIRNLKVYTKENSQRIVLLHYAESEATTRTSDIFARVWVLTPTGAGKVLYGRRYSVSAFVDDAFEPKTRGYRAKESFLPPERILANLDDVRVFSLNEARKVFQPSGQVRFTLEGAVAFVREATGESDLATAREDARKQSQDRANREGLFKNLVMQGDQQYAAGKFEESLKLYKAASAILPDIALVYADMGAVYQVVNRLPEAESSYRLALELDSEDMDTLFNLGTVLEQTGRPQDALRCYQQVAQKRSQDIEARDRMNKLVPRLNR